jgi:hypothetical protein
MSACRAGDSTTRAVKSACRIASIRRAYHKAHTAELTHKKGVFLWQDKSSEPTRAEPRIKPAIEFLR